MPEHIDSTRGTTRKPPCCADRGLRTGPSGNEKQGQMKTQFAFFAFTLSMSCLSAQHSETYLQLEKTISMPRVEGRIDHLSIDVQNQRLFVAALGNDSVEVIDLKSGNLARSIPGLHEPQGVLYVPEVNRLYVANRKSGN